MNWFVLIGAIIGIIGAIVGTYIHVVERRADRAVAHKNADTERMKAENEAERLRNEHFRDKTLRIETEFKYSRDHRCTSPTLALEQQRDQRHFEHETAPAGSSANPNKI